MLPIFLPSAPPSFKFTSSFSDIMLGFVKLLALRDPSLKVPDYGRFWCLYRLPHFHMVNEAPHLLN